MGRAWLAFLLAQVFVASCALAYVEIEPQQQDDARDMALLESIDNTADVFLAGTIAQGTAHELSSEPKHKAAKQSRKITASAKLVQYQITVSTGTAAGASTKSAIFMTIQGDRGDTGEFSVNQGKLEAGSSSTVTAQLKDVGTISKIRLRMDGKGAASSWECAQVVIKKTGVNTRFKVGQWLVNPRQTTRWAHAEVKYMMEVKTGADAKAGTETPQYVTVFGPGGSTGEMLLKKSFECGTIATVTVLGRDVGKPSMIKLHNKGPDAWLCRSLRMVTAHGSFKFTVNKWVATPMHPKASVPVDKQYQVWIETGDDSEKDGTKGAIFMQMFGTAGATTPHFLKKGFDRGRKDSIAISAKDVGTVTNIKFTTKSKDGWHCKSVKVLYGNKKQADFDVNAWVKYPIAAALNVVADVSYRLVLKTAPEQKSSSTVGNFAINIYGTLGVTRTLPLKAQSSGTAFKKGTAARIQLKAKDVGDLTKVRLSTRSPVAWSCKDIVIWKAGKVYPFSVDKCIQFPLAATVDTTVDVKYSLAVMTGSMPKAETGATIYITLYGTRGQSRYLPLKEGFAKGTTETISFKTRDVGDLTKVKLTSTVEDGWYCISILVRYKGQTANFNVANWVQYPHAANIVATKQQGQQLA